MSEPELLRLALDRQIQTLGLARKLDAGRALAAWAEAVGPQIADRARAESLVNGTLTVVVPDAPWRQELLLRKSELITRLNATLGRNVVRDLYLVAVSRKPDG